MADQTFPRVFKLNDLPPLINRDPDACARQMHAAAKAAMEHFGEFWPRDLCLQILAWGTREVYHFEQALALHAAAQNLISPIPWVEQVYHSPAANRLKMALEHHCPGGGVVSLAKLASIIRDVGLLVPVELERFYDGEKAKDAAQVGAESDGGRTNQYTLWVSRDGHFALQNNSGWWHGFPEDAYTDESPTRNRGEFNRGAIWLLRLMLNKGRLSRAEIQENGHDPTQYDLWQEVNEISTKWAGLKLAKSDRAQGRRLPDGCTIEVKAVRMRKDIMSKDPVTPTPLPETLLGEYGDNL